ncbi:MAG: PAS-domain containing protein [Wenzhouxiangellaceae bacterium]|nr:PAS-domain containing protein [Wenzhouxiangellaceae bacterium]
MTELSAAGLALAGLVWLGLLFAVAVYGERRPERVRRLWPVVYALSLAVYCTAWTFYGTTTQALRSGWPVTPTFVGTILFFVFGGRFMIRLVQLSKQHNSTSIADFIASRFGKSSWLAAAVTAVAVLGIVPYISLQLKAVAMSFGALGVASGEAPGSWQGLAVWVAIAMALFAVLFGTRHAAATEHNRGLVLAMGFESLFKLAAMLALGGFVLFVLYPGPAAWQASTPSLEFTSPLTFATLVLLGALAMFTLPHQFHIGVVECRDPDHVRTARWLFPLFLVLIGLPILPLARAGEDLLGGRVASDLYVLMLPLAHGNSALALFAFLGGLSAATGMVILASLALSIMIGNHWLTPLLVGRSWPALAETGRAVRIQRRLGIGLVVGLAWAWSRLAETGGALADIGALSFSGLAQLAPAVVLAVYRPGLPARALLAGLTGGVAIWAYVLLVPLLAGDRVWPLEGPLGLAWLGPHGLFGLTGIEALPRAVLASLAINTSLIALVCRYGGVMRGPALPAGTLDDAQLQELAGRFLPPARVDALFTAATDRAELEAGLEHELAAVVGAASARLLLDAARRRAPVHLDTVADLVGQASEQARFSREVLSGALENMSQGICVVDKNLDLVAWNQAYLDLFDYPDELIRVGRPVADLLRCNAVRGLLGPRAGEAEREAAVARRLAHKRAGTRHRVERAWPDGRIIEIRGNPMPGGGFVATFTDVTAFRHAEEQLKRINETLEQRVGERTAELERATRAAEQASQAKSRFLAAVSHDLVQPLNAARLMTHSLTRQLQAEPALRLTEQISGALGATEDLLESLLDISRLDAGGLEPRRSEFALAELFAQLAGEFGVLAAARGLELRAAPTTLAVTSDPQLLRRILQNFLSNAVRYSGRGRILLGARRRGDRVRIGVWDTGPGIPQADRRVIFEEFRRLDETRAAPGLGLGLAIADRMARLLDHPLVLQSHEGRGTCFAVDVPRGRPAAAGPARTDRHGRGGRVLLLDNDARMRASLGELLEGWGFQTRACASAGEALDAGAFEPDLLILDYHLDDGRTGLEALAELRAAGCHAAALLISADHAAALRRAALAAGCELLHKPIRPLALRSMLRRLLGA